MFTSRSFPRVAIVCVALALPAIVQAQVGSTTDILSGTIKGTNGQPVAGATVTAISVETQVSRSKQTDAKGRYVIVFPDGGGRYQLTVRSIGVQPRTLLVQRSTDEDQLITNVTLGAGVAQQLGTVTVRDNARPQGPPGGGQDRPTPGSSERNFNPDQLSRLPLADASDLAAIAALTPGVVGLTGTDSTGSAFSVAGQRLTDNNVTLDGLSFGAASVPQDAVRNTRVITNTYDVSRGQFSGGQIASTTRSGTNTLQGTFTDQFRDPSLAFSSNDAGAFGRAYRQNSLSGGLGGPIVKNKLFVFGSFQLRGRTDPLQSLLSANPATLQRLGVSPDSVGAFLDAVTRYGIAPTLSAIPDDRNNDTDQLFVRFDAKLSDAHTLTVRVDGRRTSADAQRISSLGLPSSGGTQSQSGGGLMTTLTSHLSAPKGAIINELRAYRSTSNQHTDPYLDLPSGRVQILSSLSDNALSSSTLQFGGNSGLPQASDNVTFEASNELSYIPAGTGHRFKVGALVNSVQNDQDFTANRLGTFTFTSLADFVANRPSQYTRTLTPSQRNAESMNAALYGGDTWRVNPTFQLTYGLRVEGSRYGGAPALNPTVQSLFGYRTDRFPTELHVSPRVGFSWSPSWNTTNGTPEEQGRVQGQGRAAGPGGGGGRGGQFGGGFGGFGGGPATTFRGGIGEFRALAPTQVFSNAQSATGLSTAESQLVCIGAAVPAPDFAAYASGAASLPTQCAGGLASAPINAARPNVTVIDPDFGAPRSWRGSLGVTQRLKERLSLSLDVSYARGVAQYGFRDLNLDATPEFTLPFEGARPVYVPAATVVPGTGATSLFASRLHPELGRVLAATSSLVSDTRQATIGVNGSTRKGIQMNVSYTLMRSRDQTSFPGSFGGQGVASTTAGDPNVSRWGRSDLERRHQIQAIVSWPAVSWLELSTVARVGSGSPFTPIVGGDINGDGARNDQAFVFNPASAPDSATANGMSRLLAATPSSVRECLTSALGRVAGRASCTGPWQPSLDLSANFRPTFLNLDRRLTLTLSTNNLLGGIDQLVHGSNGLRGWGANSRPDATLLTVRGFDAARSAYVYQVNERFGQTGGTANAFRTPFQITLQARLSVGPDQVRDRLRGVFGVGANGQQNGRAMLDRLNGAVPSLVDSVIARKDSLALTDAQMTKLRSLADSLTRVNAPLADSLAGVIRRAGNNADPRTLLTAAGPLLQQIRQSSTAAQRAVQEILTPEQWGQLPEALRRPQQQRGGFGGPNGRPEGRP